MITKNLSTQEIDAWNEFVLKHPNGNFFQSYDYFRLMNSVSSFNADVIFTKSDDEITGLLTYVEQKEGGSLIGFFSNRCIIYGGPIIGLKVAEQSGLDELLNILLKKTKAIYIEFRNLHDQKDIKDTCRSNGYKYRPHVNYVVTIPSDREKAFHLLNSSKRRQVRKSLKEGVKIIEADSVKQVLVFYHILKHHYRNYVRKPLPPWEMFEAFFKLKNLGKFFLVSYQDEILGGIMCPIYKETIYEWYISTVDHKYKNIYPSVLATWAPMQYAVKNKLRYFDFLGAGQPNEEYGVRDFKSKFGGELVEYGRYLKICKPFLYKMGDMTLDLKKRLV